MHPRIQRHLRVRRWLNSLQEAVSAPVKTGHVPHSEKKHLIIIKTEAIGDYILFRNFLSYIRNSACYKDWHITLLGNEIWEPLARHFDSAYFDEAVFINRNRFLKEKNYRHSFIRSLMQKPCDEVVNATFSREYLLGDTIVRHLKAPVKTGMWGDSVSEIPLLKRMGNQYYTRLYKEGREHDFEFFRNLAFMESWLEQKIDLKAPSFPMKAEAKTPYVVLMPGAQDAFRRWDADKFRKLAEWLLQKGFEIVVSGSKADSEAARHILHNLGSKGHDKCGTSPLHQLPPLLSGASLVVCNDSGALHLAAALGVPSLGISNGNHYGRFTPYPETLHSKLHMIYPASFLNENKTESERMSKTKYRSDYAINEIEVKEVIALAERILNG